MRKKKYDRHHIIPVSRNPEMKDDPHNIVRVDRHRHECYHLLFGNKTPEEIITTLVQEFWGGAWYYVYNVCRKNHICP